MPFPIYLSATASPAAARPRRQDPQSPNSNTDADTEISPLSHEMSEAITDPDTRPPGSTSDGNENGDECAYIYGDVHGDAGHTTTRPSTGTTT